LSIETREKISPFNKIGKPIDTPQLKEYNTFMGTGEFKEVERYISQIRPYLRADGGDISLVDVLEDGTVKVRLKGACRGCPMAQVTIKNTIEAYLKSRLPFIKKVIPV